MYVLLSGMSDILVIENRSIFKFDVSGIVSVQKNPKLFFLIAEVIYQREQPTEKCRAKKPRQSISKQS